MWGTSLPEDKLAGDLGNVIGATSIGGRRSVFFTARKLAPGNLGLLQQYRHLRDHQPPDHLGVRLPLRYCGSVCAWSDPKRKWPAFLFDHLIGATK
jgi:hypothetical protein